MDECKLLRPGDYLIKEDVSCDASRFSRNESIKKTLKRVEKIAIATVPYKGNYYRAVTDTGYCINLRCNEDLSGWSINHSDELEKFFASGQKTREKKSEEKVEKLSALHRDYKWDATKKKWIQKKVVKGLIAPCR